MRWACSRQTALAASKAAFLSSASTAAVGRKETSGAGPLRLQPPRAAPNTAVNKNAVVSLATILQSLFGALSRDAARNTRPLCHLPLPPNSNGSGPIFKRAAKTLTQLEGSPHGSGPYQTSVRNSPNPNPSVFAAKKGVIKDICASQCLRRAPSPALLFTVP